MKHYAKVWLPDKTEVASEVATSIATTMGG